MRKSPHSPSISGLPDGPTETTHFRVRLGTAKPAMTPALRARGLAARVKALLGKHGGGAGRVRNSKGLSRFGRGAHAAASHTPRSVYQQRVAVKARVVRVKSGGGSAGALRAHLRYIRGRGEGTEGGLAFNESGELTNEDLLEFGRSMRDDRHHFRFILSPENGAEIDLQEFTRRFVAGVEEDLGTTLEWVAGVHRDTDNPHVHLMVRGKDNRGGDLVINREYISYGMRSRAMMVATEQLGPRLAMDIEKARVRDLKAERVTSLDLQFVEQARRRADGLISPHLGRQGTALSGRERAYALARLEHLESLGLAQERAQGVWQVDVELVARLRSLSIRHDVVKTMHARMRGEGPIAPVIVSKDAFPSEPIVGRVIDRGVADEFYDRRYLLIDARDGQAYYVPLSDYSEIAGLEASVGAIVTVRVEGGRGARAADKNLLRHASRHGGVYDPQAHEREVSSNLFLPPGVSPADYVDAHVKRVRALASRGIVEGLPDGTYRIPQDLPERAEREIGRGRDRGRVIKIARESQLDLPQQIQANGVTWLDRELVRGANPALRPRVGASAFEREAQRALGARVDHLQASGLSVDLDPKRRAALLDELYERELADAAHRLQAKYGTLERLMVGQPVSGKVTGIEELPSGPHVVVARADRFTLVPARGTLATRMGKRVTVELGGVRPGLSPQPAAWQRAITYRVHGLKRGLGR